MLRRQDDYHARVSEVGQAVGYMDQRLARCPRLYRGLLADLQRIKYLQYTRSPKGRVGIFFVPKRMGSGSASSSTPGRQTSTSGSRRRWTS